MKKLALIFSIIGILFLLMQINNKNSEISAINSLSIAKINEKVTIQGKIIDLKVIKENNFTIAKIKDNSGYIEVICNCHQIKNYKNNTLEISGRLSEYKNNLQLQADKITIIK